MTTTTASSGHRSRRRTAPIEAPRGLPFDTVVEGLVYALLLFAPLAFGTTQAWSQEVFLALIAAAALVVAAKHFAMAWAGRQSGYRWSWAYPPIVLFLTLCGLQLVPVPTAVMSAVSPGTVRLRAELLSDLPAEVLRRATVSFYPWATRQQTILVAAVAALFVVVLDVFRDDRRIRRLLAVIATAGLAVTVLAAYENLTGIDTVYGLVKVQQRNAGPFMNYSHFSQSVNLAVGAGLALLLVGVSELSEFYRSPGEWGYALREWRTWPLFAWAGLCVLGPITVLLARSRMGAISMFAAAAVTGAMLAWRARPTADRRRRGATGRAWPLVGLALVVFAAALGVGFDQFYQRLASAREADGGRWEMLQDMRHLFRQFPLVGTGLGTHEVVFPQFDRRGLAQTATHAENEYFQLMEETGGIGATLASAFLAVLAVNYVRATRRPTDPLDFAAFGLGFGLVAVLLHSGTDFGQHVPANAAVTATFAALLTTLARRRASRRTMAERTSERTAGRPSADPADEMPARRVGPVLGHGLALAVLAVAAGGALLWADRARAAEGFWWQAEERGSIVAADPNATDAAYAEVVETAVAAVERQPGNVAYRYEADRLRWKRLERRIDPVTLATSGDDASFLAAANTIDEDVRQTRQLCPTFGLPLYIAGEVAIKLDRPGGDRLVLASYRLAPNQPDTSLAAGLLLVTQPGREAEAGAAFAQYLRLGGSVEDFANACLRESKPRVVWDLVENDRRGLLYFATRMPEDKPEWAAWVAVCRRRAAKLLVAEAATPDAPAEAVAEQAAVDQAAGRMPAAVVGYQRAVNAQFGNVGWRVELARCQMAVGRTDDAAKNLHVCLQQRPGLTVAAALLIQCDAHGRGSSPTTAP